MTDDLCRMPATELMRAYRARRISPVEVAKAVLARIEMADGPVNAFCYVDPDMTVRQAAESEARWYRGTPQGLVDGVPTSIKDLMLVQGWPTRRGSRTIDADQDWPEDTACVARLREHGAVFVGKTTTPEFGWKGMTDNPLTGVTRNPWNRTVTAGGSSGGAAVAAALGMGALHTASDGAGSIRIPAAFCGVFGFKSTYGLVPTYPPSLHGTISHQGPTTRTVADAALMQTVMALPDHRDWSAPPPVIHDYRIGLDDGVSGLRVAYSPNPGGHPVEPSIAAAVKAAAKRLEDFGAIVEPADPPLGEARAVIDVLWNVGCAMVVDQVPVDRRASMDPGLLDLAERGHGVSALRHRQAEMGRERLGRALNAFHQTYDLLVTPQMPLDPFDAGQLVPPGSGLTNWLDWSPFTYPFNLSQQPTAAVPCGFSAAGLPVAVQIVAAKFDDLLVLRAARTLESSQPFALPA